MDPLGLQNKEDHEGKAPEKKKSRWDGFGAPGGPSLLGIAYDWITKDVIGGGARKVADYSAEQSQKGDNIFVSMNPTPLINPWDTLGVTATAIEQNPDLILGVGAGLAKASPKILKNLSKSVGPIKVRQLENASLRSSPRFGQDMGKVGINKQQIDDMFAKARPLGFGSKKQFQDFKNDLDTAMKKAGLEDAEVGLKGTSTTFYSENPSKKLGHHWDADSTALGDYDLNISSPKMVKKMKEAGYEPHPKYGVFKTKDINKTFPELDSFQKQWGDKLGREVNFVGYPKEQARDATEYILRGL